MMIENAREIERSERKLAPNECNSSDSVPLLLVGSGCGALRLQHLVVY